jgi:bacterioferritin-associated ferredoxin
VGTLCDLNGGLCFHSPQLVFNIREASMYKLFFAVPDELFRHHILPLFTLKDLVRIDSSALHHKLRPLVLEKVQGLVFDHAPVDVDICFAQWLGRRSIGLRYIELDQHATGTEFEFMQSSLKSLTDLDARGCNALENETLFAMLRSHCSGLKTLLLRECKNIPDGALLEMGPALAPLETLDLADGIKGDSATIRAISTHCTAGFLTTLQLGGCTNLTDEMVVQLVRAVTSLTDLDLGSTQVGDTGLQMIALNLRSLRYLDVQCCDYITNEGVLSLVALKDTLWELNFGHCHSLTDESMIPLVSACHDLNFYGICHCEDITEMTIEALAENNLHLTECDLSYTTIGGEELAHLAVTCRGLLHVNISYCNNMSTESIVMLVKVCTDLLSLELAANTQVTTTVTNEITQQPRKLEELSLCYCSDAVTEDTVLALAARCPSLTALNLSQCVAVTDTAVMGLVAACPQLKFLDLSGCTQITDVSLEALQEYCPGLQSLEVIGCKQVSEAAVDRMIEATEAAVTF